MVYTRGAKSLLARLCPGAWCMEYGAHYIQYSTVQYSTVVTPSIRRLVNESTSLTSIFPASSRFHPHPPFSCTYNQTYFSPASIVHTDIQPYNHTTIQQGPDQISGHLAEGHPVVPSRNPIIASQNSQVALFTYLALASL